MYLKTFQKHNQRLIEIKKSTGQNALQQAADYVREAYGDIDPEYDSLNDNLLLDISVSFDGTWPKRGFTYLFGGVVAIAVLTGVALDFEVLSKTQNCRF